MMIEESFIMFLALSPLMIKDEDFLSDLSYINPVEVSSSPSTVNLVLQKK